MKSSWGGWSSVSSWSRDVRCAGGCRVAVWELVYDWARTFFDREAGSERVTRAPCIMHVARQNLMIPTTPCHPPIFAVRIEYDDGTLAFSSRLKV